MDGMLRRGRLADFVRECIVRQSAEMLAAFNPFDEMNGDGAIPAAGENQH